MKKTALILLILLIFFIGFIENRSFYSNDDKRYITVWKTYGDTCYIMPYKYYGLLKPTANYIVTTNTGFCDIIWQDEQTNQIIFSCSKIYRINNDRTDLPNIVDYKSNQLYYDNIFTYFDGTYKLYKKELNYMSVNILEDYIYPK